MEEELWRRRKWGRGWEEKNANQIIDELMWKTHTKDHQHKNQLRDEMSSMGRNRARGEEKKKNSFFDKIIQSTFFTFTMMYPLCETRWDEMEENNKNILKYPIPLCWWNQMYKKFIHVAFTFFFRLHVFLSFFMDVWIYAQKSLFRWEHNISLCPPDLIFHHKFSSCDTLPL